MNILVSGAGMAGLSAALGLAARGHRVTVVERASHFRVNGSPIDVRGDAIGVVAEMGLLDEVRERGRQPGHARSGNEDVHHHSL
ncbi:MAG TPA: FAD-dependent oxidoreductase, partial [Umezawaea sp.]|nr:FAD-dependent oxidoreductase [Umezawaea sp.]